MSYIRSTSNPEKLFIYEDGYKDAVFLTGTRERLRVPLTTFKRLMKNLKDQPWAISISYKGFKVSEDQKTFKWKIAYKSQNLIVFKTTLQYILQNNDWK